MAESRSLTPISMADYEAIEAAVMETERGRWFLREYAKRNRNADTELLLEAITRLEQKIAGDGHALDRADLSAPLREMARAIALTREQAGEFRRLESDFDGAPNSEPLLDIVRASKEAALAGRRAAGEIRQAAAVLRPETRNGTMLDGIEHNSTEVATAFDRTEAGTQTLERIVGTLRYLETRIQEMLSREKAPASEEVSLEPRAEIADPGNRAVAENEGPSSEELEEEATHGSRPEPDETEPLSRAGESTDIETRELAARDHGARPDLVENHQDHDAIAGIVAVEKAAAGAPEAMIPKRDAEPEIQRVSPLQHHSAASAEASESPIRPKTSGAPLAAREAAASAASRAGEPAPRLRPTFRREAFAEIDRLTTREKLRLFS